MPGFLVTATAQVQCFHAGTAQPTAVNTRLLAMGDPTVVVSAPYVVAGCALPPPPAANGPCVSGQFLTAATRVTSLGQPVLLQDGQAVCAPSGTGLLVLATQTRVTGV